MIKVTMKKTCLLLLACAIVLITYISIDIYTYGSVNELVKSDAAIVLGAVRLLGMKSRHRYLKKE